MAIATLITRANFGGLLVRSTEGRAGVPDGNIFFGEVFVEIITREELPQVDLGSGLEDNPLTNDLGITLQAVHAFEVQERAIPGSALRNFLQSSLGVFSRAGAWRFVNNRRLAADGNSSTGDDRTKIRGSGWEEYAGPVGQANLNRVYFGPRSLNPVEATSQPFVQIPASLSEADLQAAAPIDAARLGPLDQAFQVFGTTANGDAGAGDFDFRDRPLVAKVRTFGQTQGQATSTGTGVSELAGFSTGFGLGEDLSPVAGLGVAAADVFGPGAVAPFDVITFQRFGTPQVRSGFTQGNGNFTDIVSNPAGASLLQLRAWLDAAMGSDDDIDQGSGTFRAKRADPLYSIDTQGRIVTRQGLHIDNVPTADRQSIVQTDDAGQALTYPFDVETRFPVSDAWAADPAAWGTVHYLDGVGGADHDTAGAVLVQDSTGADYVFTQADLQGVPGAFFVSRPYDYDGNTQAGLLAGTDKDIVAKFGGNGGAQEVVGEGTITRQAIVSIPVRSPAEDNI